MICLSKTSMIHGIDMDERRMLMRKIALLLIMVLIVGGLFAAGNQETTSATSPEVAWPTQNVTITVPFVAGGAADIIARKIATMSEPLLGKPVVVVNRVGAGGIIALTEYMKEKPNTHNILLLGRAQSVTIPNVQTNKLAYSRDDLIPIIGIENINFVLFANAKTGIHDMESLKQYASTKKSLKYGTTGAGTDIAVLQGGLYGLAGVKAEAVTYGGAREAVLNAANGVVDVAVAAPTSVIDLLADGSVVPVGVFSNEPYTGFEGITVPSFASQGYDINAPGLNYLAIRSGTDQQIVDKLYGVFSTVFASEEYKEFAKNLLVDINGWDSEKMTQYLDEQDQVIKKLVQYLEIK